MGLFKRRHRHSWFIVHHTDDHDHHWCPTGYMMCGCGQMRRSHSRDPVCDIRPPVVVDVWTFTASDTVSSAAYCFRVT